MADDVAQLEHSNNKCYASAFRYIYIYIYIDIDYKQWFQDFFKLILRPPLMGNPRSVLAPRT